ncbi:cell surface protein [Myxococcota bacterium]|nr:cell surface protein [Myxococcota bacterium]
MRWLGALALALSGCKAGDAATDTAETGGADSGVVDTAPVGPDAFADAVESFMPGPYAGFGQDKLPDVVLGPPTGGEGGNASLDVLSLGEGGVIVLRFDDIGLIDGEGPDLLVFENPFTGWYEPGVVGVSEDGVTFVEWPCDATDEAGEYPGCAGVGLVYSNPDNGIDPTDPEVAGGDAFDLAELGVSRARFVRIREPGTGSYEGTSAGFDLDAVAVVNGEAL